jgi:NAD(P)-dependent dehydrogenase (short-subunit alcohol dehydrogenase family)
MSELEGKVVLITGAGRGLGRALALAFAGQGAWVAANDLTPVNLDETLRLADGQADRVKDYLADVSSKMALQGMILQILDDWGRLDVLVNNAAVAPRAALLDMDEWDWRRTLDVNLTGAFFATQVAGRVMRQQGGGVIVNIGQAPAGLPGLRQRGAYLASKAGLVELTRQAARELGPYAIRVNAVLPGLIESESTLEAYPEAGERQRLAQAIPQGRLGLPQDVVAAVLFLCSPAAAYLTGQAIAVDGGGYAPG